MKIFNSVLVVWFLISLHSSLTAMPKVPLKFGPEFEFTRQHFTVSKLPLRRQIFSEAIRHFAPHLDLSIDSNIPRQWYQNSPKKFNYKQDIHYQGRLPFLSTPALWPDLPAEVFIDTANLNDLAPLERDPAPKIEVSFAEGKSVQVAYTVDDVVLEAHVNPMSLEDMRHFKPVLDDLVFAPSRTAPIQVPANGGGHMHIDLLQILKRADQIDPKPGLRLIRNFIVDFYSHSHFISFALRAHPTWALVLGMTSPERVEWFRNAILRLDDQINSAEINGFDEALKFIEKNFRPINLLLPISLINGDEYDRLAFPPEIGIYKSAIQFSKKHQTMEIRALAAQRTYQEFIDLAQLFNARLDYLAGLDHEVDLPVWDEIRIIPSEIHHKELAPRTINKLQNEIISYVNGSMSHIPINDRPSWKSRLFDMFRDRLLRYRCVN